MKRYILTSLCLLTYLTLSAQEPKEALFTVNALTEDGRDTTFVVSAINVNSFSFVGGGGKVTNPENGRKMTVDNVDLYSYIDYEERWETNIKTIINPDLEFAERLCEKVGVGTVPGSSFFKEPVNDYVRFHFAKKDETLLKALDRLSSIREKMK